MDDYAGSKHLVSDVSIWYLILVFYSYIITISMLSEANMIRYHNKSK